MIGSGGLIAATATGHGLSSEEVFFRLMFAMAAVILAARVAGSAVARIGQPRVMGEVLAGILLGPSLLTRLFPDFLGELFHPTAIVPLLAGAADIGLAFYMFLVGLELDSRLLQGRVRQAAIISNASVAVPMVIGALVAIPIHDQLAPDGVPIAPFALFLGVSMSITAFPVLARILVERGLIRHPVGALALAAAAVDDVTAWGLLALATAVASATVSAGAAAGDPVTTTLTVVLQAVLFCVFMATVVRRGLARLAVAFDQAGHVPATWIGIIFVGVLLSAGLAGFIKIAPIFGAFVLGLVMPRGEALSRDVAHRLEDFVGIVLLPLFFAVAGLKANVFLIDDASLAGWTVLLILVAIGTKFGSAAVAARASGMGGRESLAIGALMNTRGLTELIVLNIAFEAGIIGPELFTMLVIMALVTTFMAGPLLRLIDPRGEMTGDAAEEALAAPAGAAPAAASTIVVAALDARNLQDLFAIAHPLARTEPAREIVVVRLLEPASVTTGVNELDQRHVESQEELARLRALDPSVRTAVFTSTRPARDLVRIAGSDRVDLMLVDGRRALLGGMLGGPVRSLLEEAASDVAVLVRGSQRAVELAPDRPIVVPFGGAEHDWAALELGAWIAGAVGARLRLLGAAEGERDPSRLLANASVVLQQMTGLAAETRLVSASGLVGSEATADASLLVVGLSDRWRQEGLGPVRTRLAEEGGVPVVFVRRGTRPGALAPRDDLTRFTWSFPGSGGARGGGDTTAPGDAR